MIKWDQHIFASVGLRVKYPELRFGIELEFERMREEYPRGLVHWRCERDPSLRNNGVEFISKPLVLDELDPALHEAQQCVNMFDLDPSWRCGLHTHVNVSYWTWKQLIQHAVLYALVEPYIFAEFAPGRESSHFCVPLWGNTRLIDNIADDAVRLRAGRVRDRDLNMAQCCKYSALNYKPIFLQGTIEFRHMPATANMNRVREWCDMLQRLVDVSHSYGSPEEIVQEFEDIGIEDILTKLGLHTCDVPEEDVDDAYIAACMLGGYDPAKWQDLRWDMPNMVVHPDDANRVLDRGQVIFDEAELLEQIIRGEV